MGVALVVAGTATACVSTDGASVLATTTSTTTTAPATVVDTLLEDAFDRPDGVVTDERSWHDDSGTAVPDDTVWAATSGVLHASGGQGWSDSPVFRMVTHRSDFGDVAVSFRAQIDERARDGSRPEEAWDGLHVLLHYQDETELYAVSVSRRDGEVAIKRKDPGGPSNGGSYSTLAHGPGAMPEGRWSDVRVTIREAPGGMELTVELDGRSVLRALDEDAVGARASRPGRIGIRADNTTFRIDDLRVDQLSPAGN